MKNKILGLSIIATAINSTVLLGQVGIGTTSPHNSSILHLNSTNKGLLITNIAITSATDASTIPSPATGLLVWNNGTGGLSPAGFYYWNNSQWNILSTGNLTSGGSAGGWTTSGNNLGTSSGANTALAFGTSTYDDLIFKVNNSEIGRLGVNRAITFGTGTSATQDGVAIGTNAKTTSNEGIAIGNNSLATGYRSLALGYNTKANSNESIAVGFNTIADGYQSLSIGHGAKTSSNGETALGLNAQTSNQNSTALGAGSKGLGQNSIALGYNAQATSYNATALGSGSSANGQNSTAIGYGASTNQVNAIVIGDQHANVGIGTSTPNITTKLDVNGQYKLGDKGNVHKNKISFEVYPSISISGLQPGRSTFIDITIPIALRPNSTNATIIVSPANDFAGNDNFGINNARMTSISNIRVNLTNITNGNQNLNSGHFFVTINEF